MKKPFRQDSNLPDQDISHQIRFVVGSASAIICNISVHPVKKKKYTTSINTGIKVEQLLFNVVADGGERGEQDLKKWFLPVPLNLTHVDAGPFN